MNVIEKYYLKKATMGQKDDFYDRIDTHDIFLIRKA